MRENTLQRDSGESPKEIVKEGIKNDGVRDAASALIEDVEKFGKATRDAASQTLDSAQKSIKKNIAEFYGKGQEKLHEVESYVQKHPTRVLLIAAAAGFVLGFLRKKMR